MDKTTMDTEFINDELGCCDNIEDLKKDIIPKLKTQEKMWKEKFNEILDGSDLTDKQFAELCGENRANIYNWKNGAIPKKRETLIKIGLAAGYGREEIDTLLQKYGRYPALYSKTMEDCVCIYVLEHNYGKEAVKKYTEIINRIRSGLCQENSGSNVVEDTELFDEKLSGVPDEDGLSRFISEHMETFSNAFNKFDSYVIAQIIEYFSGSCENIYKLALAQNWSSSLRQSVSAINQGKWFPTRNKIISLGLHLCMSKDQINGMLKAAHMEPLYAKNIFEGVIIFILEDAELNNIFSDDPDEYDPDALFKYAKEVMENLEQSEFKQFIKELTEEKNEMQK